MSCAPRLARQGHRRSSCTITRHWPSTTCLATFGRCPWRSCLCAQSMGPDAWPGQTGSSLRHRGPFPGQHHDGPTPAHRARGAPDAAAVLRPLSPRPSLSRNLNAFQPVVLGGLSQRSAVAGEGTAGRQAAAFIRFWSVRQAKRSPLRHASRSQRPSAVAWATTTVLPRLSD